MSNPASSRPPLVALALAAAVFVGAALGLVWSIQAMVQINAGPVAPQQVETQVNTKRVAMATTVAQARSGEGVIAITTRVCGSSKTWKTNAASNRISPPAYRVMLGQKLTINCNGAARPTKASRSAPRVTAQWVRPLATGRAGSCYGWRWGALHQGVDIPAGYGTPIRAVTAGRVVKAGWWSRGYGISVLLNHGSNGYTHYAHMSRDAVGVGQWVRAGQIIGYVGSTGDSTGNHLHFEHWLGMWGQHNPAPWLRAHGIGVGC